MSKEGDSDKEESAALELGVSDSDPGPSRNIVIKVERDDDAAADSKYFETKQAQLGDIPEAYSVNKQELQDGVSEDYRDEEDMGNLAQRRPIIRLPQDAAALVDWVPPRPIFEVLPNIPAERVSSPRGRSPMLFIHPEGDFIGPFGKKRRMLRERLNSEDLSGEISEDSVGATRSSSFPAKTTATRQRRSSESPKSTNITYAQPSQEEEEEERIVSSATTEFYRIGIQDPLVRTLVRRRSLSAEHHGSSAPGGSGGPGTSEPLNLSRDAEFSAPTSLLQRHHHQHPIQYHPHHHRFPSHSDSASDFCEENPLNLSSKRLSGQDGIRLGGMTGAPTSVIVTMPNFSHFSHPQSSSVSSAASSPFIDIRRQGVRKPGRPRKIITITTTVPAPGSASTFEERRGSIIVTPASKAFEARMDLSSEFLEDELGAGGEEEGTPDSTTTSSSGSSNKPPAMGECETGEPGGQKKKKKSKDYYCDKCDRWFSQLRNYRYHMSRHEGTFIFACTCPECGKRFNDKGYLSSHMKIHRNLKEYVCEYCGKSFNQRVAYNMHTRIHTGLKPHQCKLCPKAFSRKMLLRQHERTHTGERPFHCSVCEKSFADRSNMLLHERLHTGERPYKCEQCGKAFSKNHHLKTHMNHHLGIRPYQCPQCHATFTQSSNMKTHMKKCTGTLHLTGGTPGEQPYGKSEGSSPSTSQQMLSSPIRMGEDPSGKSIVMTSPGSGGVMMETRKPRSVSEEHDIMYSINPALAALAESQQLELTVTVSPFSRPSEQQAYYTSSPIREKPNPYEYSPVKRGRPRKTAPVSTVTSMDPPGTEMSSSSSLLSSYDGPPSNPDLLGRGRGASLRSSGEESVSNPMISPRSSQLSPGSSSHVKASPKTSPRTYSVEESQGSQGYGGNSGGVRMPGFSGSAADMAQLVYDDLRSVAMYPPASEYDRSSLSISTGMSPRQQPMDLYPDFRQPRGSSVSSSPRQLSPTSYQPVQSPTVDYARMGAQPALDRSQQQLYAPTRSAQGSGSLPSMGSAEMPLRSPSFPQLPSVHQIRLQHPEDPTLNYPYHHLQMSPRQIGLSEQDRFHSTGLYRPELPEIRNISQFFRTTSQEDPRMRAPRLPVPLSPVRTQQQQVGLADSEGRFQQLSLQGEESAQAARDDRLLAHLQQPLPTRGEEYHPERSGDMHSNQGQGQEQEREAEKKYQTRDQFYSRDSYK